MAASSHKDRSIEDPLTFVQDNVVATCNILNFARKNSKLELFIYFSTDEVFGPAPKDVNYKEKTDIIQQILTVLQKLVVKN